MELLREIRESLFGRGSLEGGGARVDIDLRDGDPSFDSLDLYERSHWRRYEFALGVVPVGADVADLACGTGYGSVLLARRAAHVVGVDVDETVIAAARRRYRKHPSVTFLVEDLRELCFTERFDAIVSFETVEHFDEAVIPRLFEMFARALTPEGILIFSTPYRQKPSPEALRLGHHRTFLIDEPRIESWLSSAALELVELHYQDYATHTIRGERGTADFIICLAKRPNA